MNDRVITSVIILLICSLVLLVSGILFIILGI